LTDKKAVVLGQKGDSPKSLKNGSGVAFLL
jgi:hypothetical protein